MSLLIYVDILKEVIDEEYIDRFFDQVNILYGIKEEEFRIQEVFIKGTLKFVYVFFKDVEFYKKLLHLDDEFITLSSLEPYRLPEMFKFNEEDEKIRDINDNLSLNCRIIDINKTGFYFYMSSFCNINFELRKDIVDKVKQLFKPFNSSDKNYYPKVYFLNKKSKGISYKPNTIVVQFDDETIDCIKAYLMFKVVKIDNITLSFKPIDYNDEDL